MSSPFLARARSDEARRRALQRRELFPCRKLSSDRAAAAVQRACAAAATAEIVFLPTHPEARKVAEKTWAKDACKLDAFTMNEDMAGVRELFEGQASLRKQAVGVAAVQKAKKKLSGLVTSRRAPAEAGASADEQEHDSDDDVEVEATPEGSVVLPQLH